MLLNIDAAGSDLIPNNTKALAIIKNVQVKDTSTGGKMLVVCHEILNGSYKGEAIWNNFNVVNNNADAVRISQNQLRKIARALGIQTLRDSADLVNARKPMMVTIGIDKGKGGYDDKNIVIGWDAADAANAEPAEPVKKTGTSDFPF